MNRMLNSNSSSQVDPMAEVAIAGMTTTVPWVVEIVAQTIVVEAMTRATTHSSSSSSNKQLVSRCRAIMIEEVR